MLSITGQSPSEGNEQASVDSNIEFTILDDGTGIDTSSLIVEINGSRAITGVDFLDGFNGISSEITPDGDDLNIVIDPESNFSREQQVLIKIQVKTLDGKYFNYAYMFRTIPEAPILVTISPEDKSTINKPQFIYLEFQDEFDSIDKSSINIEINDLSYVSAGQFTTDPNGFLSEFIEDTGSIIVRIDPAEALRDGDYIVTYSVSDSNSNKLRGRSRFTVNMKEAVLPATFPQTGFVGFFQGMKKVSDLGNGKDIKLEWGTVARRSYQSDAFVLIYENDNRLKTFDGLPKYIAPSDTLEATLKDLETQKTKFYGARAMETYKDSFSLVGLEEIDTNLYRIPGAVSIATNTSTTDSIIYVDSVSGYPEKGYLLIENEIIKYNGISSVDNAFLVTSKGRGVNDSTPGIYIPGDTVQLFLSCTDSNTVIVSGTPTYQNNILSGRELNNVGLVVTDSEDDDKKFFQGFDFCGYHTARPDQIFQGIGDCGSYLGGEFNGFRGMNLFDRMLNREEVLLDNVGEPVILLRRIWNGQTCWCMDARRVHPKVKTCTDCLGTGYVGGYQQFENKRRVDRRIMVSFQESAEDLTHGQHEHLKQAFEPPAWTLPMPIIRDRDVLVRFDFTNDIEYFYEVLDVSREKMIYRHHTRQRLRLIRLDKTDVIYTYNLNLSNI